MDYLEIYNLEVYLFNTVRQRFKEQGYLSAFDFFCIVIWKANRAKSKVAKKLLKNGHSSLDEAVLDLTQGLSSLSSAEDRLRYLWDWGQWEFYLPMASAILTVLYPEDFTIYDVRVCEALGAYSELRNITKFEKLWPRYMAFRQAVEQSTPTDLSLRDKDRYLWGKSFSHQLTTDIQQGFAKASNESAYNNQASL